MCGLFASIGLPPDPARIDMVAHRGPDGRGFDVHASEAGPVVLGHRRLSIIDLSPAGHQPMADPSGRYRLIYNGEIYNYLELRDELAMRGERFATQTDSEVLLRAYAVWGADCLPRLRGMFAFIIWDTAERTLVAARDRFGIKPLYVCAAARTVAFASEIKQLLGLPGANGRMNRARVEDFLASSISDHTAETMFDGVRQLRGGELCIVDAFGAVPQMTIRRWSTVGTERSGLSESDAAERFRSLLDRSVRLHLRSDVPIGSCLSGGLDSSSIVMLMGAALPAGQTPHTVSACYAEAAVDERPYIDMVVDAARATPHHVFPSAADVIADVERITWHQDEPFGSTSIVAQWCVFAETARQGIKVMLDGQGADELLAGYHFAYPAHLAHLIRTGRLREALALVNDRRVAHGAPVGQQLARAVSALLPAGAADVLRRRRRDGRHHGWLAADSRGADAVAGGALGRAAADAGLPLPHDLASFSDLMTHAGNLPMLLHWEDRNAMAHGVEARVPFLDPPLADFCLALGNDHKTVGVETKRVLRRAMADVLPTAVAGRRDKLGFATPESDWMRGPLRTFMHEGVESALSRFPSLFRPQGARALRDDMLAGRIAPDPALWRIVSLGVWGGVFGVAE